MTEYVVQVDNLRKVFHDRRRGGTVAVDGVTFAMTAGRNLGIVGESGSGKSTIARIIMGLESASSGSVRVFGEDMALLSRRRRDRLRRAKMVQMVYQDPYGSLDPRQTVRSCLDEALRLHAAETGQRRRSRIAELGDLVGLSSEQIERSPSDLSGGQRQRVAIARALAVEPKLIVLDEAVAALDISIQAQILNLLEDLREELGTSYLLISHDLSVVRHLTEDIVVMHNGSIVEQGSTEHVLAEPRETYTRKLRASVPGQHWRIDGTLEALIEGR